MLSFRFVLVNAVGAALVFAAWAAGLLDELFATDHQHLVKIIVATFVVGTVWAGQRVSMLTRELNALDERHPPASTRTGDYLRRIAGRDAATRANLASAVKLKIAHRISTVRHVAASLVLLGLIGTVIGFIEALSGVDPTTVSDIAQVPTMVATLLAGMHTALYKTLVGAVLNIWLMMSYRLLESGSVHFLTRLVERGEADGRV